MIQGDPDLQTSSTAPAPEPEAAPPDETDAPTHERLRAFEDDVLGEDHPRPHGQIERGIGSKFASLHPTVKAHHAALLALIDAEAEYQKAAAIELEASEKLDAAIQRAAETEEALPADPEPDGAAEETV